MIWLDIVLQGISAIVGQWAVSSAEEKKEIETRALTAVHDMLTERKQLEGDHDTRVLATLAAIEIARKAAK